MQASKKYFCLRMESCFFLTHSEPVPGPLHPPLEVPDAATQQDVLALDRSLEKGQSQFKLITIIFTLFINYLVFWSLHKVLRSPVRSHHGGEHTWGKKRKNERGLNMIETQRRMKSGPSWKDINPEDPSVILSFFFPLHYFLRRYSPMIQRFLKSRKSAFLKKPVSRHCGVPCFN